MTPAWTLALVAAMTSAALASPVAPVARYAPKGYPSLRGGVQQLDAVSYLYVTERQGMTVHTGGAGATITQADPGLGQPDFHSLAEIAVETGDAQEIVELGWTIDLGVNGDLQPHVFAFHWHNGQPTCYNACGWVQVSKDTMPGMRIAPGEAHLYEIRQRNGDWWLYYDGDAMGYFPQTEFAGTFTQATLVQWFGEVAAATGSPCTQMGTGKLGADGGAATFDDMHLFDPDGTTAAAGAMPGLVSDTALYNIGQNTRTRFGFGGPGATTGCCTPSTCQAQAAQCGAVPDPVCAGNTLACGTCDGCTADHKCPNGIGLPDTGGPFDMPIPMRAGGGCCDAGASGSGALVLGALVAPLVRRRRQR